MVIRRTVACLLVIGLMGCDQGPTAPTPITPVGSVGPQDFTGQVLTPSFKADTGDHHFRWDNKPVPGVEVTMVAGPRVGESAQTDQDGRYSFPEFDGDEIHLRLEKNDYEPKEVFVHRTRPTTLPDQAPLMHDGPQKRPRTVLIGLQWPDYVRSLMQQMRVIHDLLLSLRPGDSYTANYGNGVIMMADRQQVDAMFHEVCHAHQHLVANISGGSSGWWSPRWDASPEGQAYQEATTADINEVGRDIFDASYRVKDGLAPGNVLVEGAAEACATFWLQRYNYNHNHNYGGRENAPNRWLWAEEWLPR